VDEFNREAGIGITVSDEEVVATIEKIFGENDALIKEQGHAFDFSKLIYKARDLLKWADQKKVMELINKKKADILATIPKDESAGKKKKVAAAAAPVAPKEEEKKPVAAESEAAAAEEATTGKNLSDIIGRDIEAARNSEEVLKKHRAATGGKIMTRFPPEPNGYLHIGHAKAMRFNFTFAQENGGQTYLRYDDTNPCKEN
jgi:glutaminyl-tRNA synthetase